MIFAITSIVWADGTATSPEEAIAVAAKIEKRIEGRKQPALKERGNYAMLMVYVGDFERARSQFAKGIAMHPDWYGLHNGLGWAYLQLGDRSRARQSFQRALQLKPDLADAQEGLRLAGR